VRAPPACIGELCLLDVPSGVATASAASLAVDGSLWLSGTTSTTNLLASAGATGWASLLPVEEQITSIAAVSADDVWLAGRRLFHWDGVGLSQQSDPSGEVCDISALSADDVWVVKWFEQAMTARLIRWDGAEWREISTPPRAVRPTTVLAASDAEIWLLAGADALRWNGSRWDSYRFTRPLKGGWAAADAGAWVFDEFGALYRFADGAWHAQDLEGLRVLALGGADGRPVALVSAGAVTLAVEFGPEEARLVEVPGIADAWHGISVRGAEWLVWSRGGSVVRWNGSCWSEWQSDVSSHTARKLSLSEDGARAVAADARGLREWLDGRWLYLPDFGADLVDVAVSADTIFVAGGGELHTYSADHWLNDVLPAGTSAEGVHVTRDSSVWVAAGPDKTLKLDGKSFLELLHASPGSLKFVSTTGQRAWLARSRSGGIGSVLESVDRAQWMERHEFPGFLPTALTGDGGSAFFSTYHHRTGAGAVWRVDGGGAVPVQLGLRSSGFNSVARIPGGLAFGSGEGMATVEGGTSRLIPMEFGPRLLQEVGDDLWAVDSRWNVRRDGGDGWTDVTTAAVTDIWGDSHNNVWLIGLGGVNHWDGERISTVSPPLQGVPTAVWGALDGKVWIGSDAGEMARYDGTGWSVSRPSTRAILGLSGSSPADVWAVGEGGLTFRWDGSTWSPYATGLGANIVTVEVSSPSLAWAATDQGVVLAWDGTAWSVIGDLELASPELLAEGGGAVIAGRPLRPGVAPVARVSAAALVPLPVPSFGLERVDGLVECAGDVWYAAGTTVGRANATSGSSQLALPVLISALAGCDGNGLWMLSDAGVVRLALPIAPASRD